MILEYAFVVLLCLGLSQAGPAEELVVDLPGVDFPINFKQYSGYVKGTKGRNLHYWLTESQNDPAKDPLVLWLNGGPGCSSISGLLEENGPFFVKSDGTGLYPNTHSWNLIANLLFLETPACVGFSYDDNKKCRTDDVEVAEMNYLALKNFFDKFPEYRNRELFIAGESYAGIYIPMLSVRIVEGQSNYPINFQGFAIGNGILSYSSNQNSLMFFGHYHALLGDDIWDELVGRCCDGYASQDTCNFQSQSAKPLCQISVIKASNILYNSGMNLYNIYSDCESAPAASRDSYDWHNLMISFERYEKPVTFAASCIDDSNEIYYMNLPEVRKALHIPRHVQPWTACSNDVFRTYVRVVFEVSKQLKFLHRNNVRGLIFNGDVDMACNFLGNQWDVESLEYKITEARRAWHENGQVAGFIKRFKNLDFVTIKGSGHMVPEDKPEEALKMFDFFLNNSELD